MANEPTATVIAWGKGAYTFRTRWETAMFRWIMRRWSGWTNWDVLSEAEQESFLRHRAALRKPSRGLHLGHWVVSVHRRGGRRGT